MSKKIWCTMTAKDVANFEARYAARKTAADEAWAQLKKADARQSAKADALKTVCEEAFKTRAKASAKARLDAGNSPIFRYFPDMRSFIETHPAFVEANNAFERAENALAHVQGEADYEAERRERQNRYYDRLLAVRDDEVAQ